MTQSLLVGKTVSSEPLIELMETKYGKLANAHRGSVTAVYADANYILSGGQDGAVRVWARSNRKLLI